LIGSSINISINTDYPNKFYILGLANGDNPGFNIGSFHIPLNFDYLFILSVFYPSFIGLVNSIGILDNLGDALVTWNIPVISSMAGSVIKVAFVVLDTSPPNNILIVSNAINIILLGEYSPDLNTGALWHLDEGSGNIAFDSSSNNNHANLINGTIWTADTAPIPGSTYALQFDGINDYAVVANNLSLSPQNQITIEFWVRIFSLNNMVIIDKTPNANNQGYLVDIDNGKVHFILNNEASLHLTSNNQLNLGQWHHVAAVYNGNTMKIFINGVQDPATISFSGSINQNNLPLYIGRHHPTQGTTYYFNGILDEVRISNIARY